MLVAGASAQAKVSVVAYGNAPESRPSLPVSWPGRASETDLPQRGSWDPPGRDLRYGGRMKHI